MSEVPARLDIVNLSRRSLLGVTPAVGLILAVGFPRFALAGDEPKYGADGMPHGWVDDPLVFVAIAPDGTVTITCHRQEMGQGVRTSLPMVVADELEADFSRVLVRQAQGDEARFGNQDTDGSRSVRHFFEPMRRCGAAARTMLEQAAAAQWGVPLAQVSASNHEVVHHPTNRKLGYGALAVAASRLPVPARDSLRLKSPAQFRYIGKGEVRIVDGPDIVAGRGKYGIDTRLEGMLYAVIARPAVYGGRVVSHDATEALKIAGVVRVVEIPGTPVPSEFQPLGGVAVLATNTWAAIQGRNALTIQWDDGPNGSYDSTAYKASLETSVRNPGRVVRNEGDAAAAMKSAARLVQAEYYVPHMTQAPMEPPAATARIVDGRCEVWACVQAPQVTRDRVAKRLGLSADRVTVNVTLLGGGFGRKSKPDYTVEAALLSKASIPTTTRSRSSISRRVSTPRASRSRGCTAAPRHPYHRSSDPIPSTSRPWSWAWDWWTCRLRYPTCASKIPKSPRTRGSAGIAPCRTSRTLSRSSRLSPSSPRRRNATRRTTCWN